MAVNVQVYDFYQWSIWWKRYQLELTLWPLLQIFERPKTCTDPPFLYMRPAEPWSFWAANSTAICKRICAFPLNVAFILCGLCKEHSEKEVSRKNNEGKGCGVRVVKTPLMVLFNKSFFRILPVYQVLVNAMNGLFWQLLSTFEGLLPYGNAKWQRWDHQLEGLLSKKYFVHWLSLPLRGLKCPLRRTDSTTYTMFILINSW